jgi:ribosomal protein S12 methylthiotransferase accessory factor YcaO
MTHDLVTSMRQVPPGQTLAAIEPLLSAYDILGVADHTPPGLTLIRSTEVFRGAPRSGYLNLGKGFGREAALASGYMEALEMCIIERAPEVPLVQPDALPRGTLVYDARDRSVRTASGPAAEPPVGPLIPGCDLLNGAEVYGWRDDLHLAGHPGGTRTVSTTGLASGNTLAEAQLHAVYELIERHVSFLAAGRPLSVVRVELESPPRLLRDALAELQAAGIGVEIYELGRLHGLGVFQCALTSEPYSDAGGPQVNFGWGAHHSVAIAVSRAVSEAVQAYATRRACRLGAIPPSRMRGGALISAQALSGLRTASSSGEQVLHARLRASPGKALRLDAAEPACTADEALAGIIALMRAAGTPHLLCWTLSAADRPFSVVKCVVPGFDSLTP